MMVAVIILGGVIVLVTLYQTLMDALNLRKIVHRTVVGRAPQEEEEELAATNSSD